MTDLQATRHRKLVAFFQEVDQIVAVSRWVREVLMRNGVLAEKITLSRHGISQVATSKVGAEVAAEDRNTRRPLRIAFVGRLYPIKGAHILIEAVRRKPALPMELEIFGVIQDEEAKDYQRKLERLVVG